MLPTLWFVPHEIVTNTDQICSLQLFAFWGTAFCIFSASLILSVADFYNLLKYRLFSSNMSAVLVASQLHSFIKLLPISKAGQSYF